MRVWLLVNLCVSTVGLAACNTPPVPPGKPVDIPTALQQVLEGLCAFKQEQAAKNQHWAGAIDSITVELDLTVDGARNPPVAVAPDIQFIPTVSYGHILTANRGSRLVLSLKPSALGDATAAAECNARRAAQ